MTSSKSTTSLASLANKAIAITTTSFLLVSSTISTTTLLVAAMSAITLTSPTTGASFVSPSAVFARRRHDDNHDPASWTTTNRWIPSLSSAGSSDDTPEQPPVAPMGIPAAAAAAAASPPLLWMEDNETHELLVEATATTTPSATAPLASLRAKLGLPVIYTNEKEEESAAAPTALLSSSLPIKVVGHRGALYEFLENTREGFLHCAQLGCHAVELDVFVLPRDGSVVVFHGGGTDERPGLLQEYCQGYDDDNNNNSDHSILDLTFEESQLLQFNPDFAEFGCDRTAVEQGRIPLLQDVLLDLQAFPDMEIKIELKGQGTVQPVLQIVERLQMQRQCSYSSFDLRLLHELRQLRPDCTLYRTGALFTVPPTNLLELARDCGATEIHLRYDECTTACIAAIHQAGFASMAWFRGPMGMHSDAQHKYFVDMGNEDERCYQAVLETGVQQLCCNRPDVLLRLLAKQQEQQQQQTWMVG